MLPLDRSCLKPGLLLLLLPILAFMIYWPGLKGDFLFDDFANLPQLGDYGGVRDWETFKLFVLGNSSGPSGRPLSMLSFLLDDNTWPSDPESFKYTNILLHLLTGVLLSGLIYKLILLCDPERRENRAAWIAVLTAALWLLHPLNVSTTLYVVQRMAVLSALFIILGLLLYVHGRSLLATRPRQAYLWMTLSVVVCTPLAFLSKENGALLPLLILIVEYTALRHPAKSPVPKRLWSFIFLGLPVILLIGYFALHWDGILGGYDRRPFTLSERLFTESRIVMSYLYDLFLPGLKTSGLFNENITLSRSLIDPPSTLVAILFIIVLNVSGWLLRTRYPLFSLAILFFFAGHLLESTVIPLELYFEHRNYLPSIFLFLPLISWAIDETQRRQWALPVVTLFIGVFAFLTYQQAMLWGNGTTLMLVWAQQNPFSIRAQRTAAIEWEKQGRPDLALRHLKLTLDRFPNDIELWIHWLVLRCHYGEVSTAELTRIEALLREGFYDFRTYPLLESLVNSAITKNCQAVKPKVAHRLLDALLQNPAAQARGPQRQIYHLQGVLYAHEGRPDLALDNFQASQRTQANVDTGLLQVAILGNHGMPAHALELLKTIRKLFQRNRDGRSPLGKLDYATEIARLEQVLREDLSKKDTSEVKRQEHRKH